MKIHVTGSRSSRSARHVLVLSFSLLYSKPLFMLSFLLGQCHLAGEILVSSKLHHLPPHLREVCTILAAGLARLRRRTAEDLARDAALAGENGESSLHFTAHQSGHAVPKRRPA